MNERHSAADQIIDQMPDKPEIIHCTSNPCYIPAVDQVRLPDISAFKNAEAYYHAIYHEIVQNAARMIMPHEIDFMLLLLHLRCIHTE